MKKKIILLILITIVVFLVSVISIPIYNDFIKSDSVNAQKNKIEISYDYTNKLNICNDDDNCPYYKEEFYLIVNAVNVPYYLEKTIDGINKQTLNYYNESKSSLMNNISCSGNEKIYKYRYQVSTTFNDYIDNDVISITLSRQKTDFCTNEVEYIPLEVYIYDIKEDKLLTQEEVMEKYNVSEESVVAAISYDLKTKNSIENTDYSIDNTYRDGNLEYELYFDDDGNLKINYYQNQAGKYFTTSLW